MIKKIILSVLAMVALSSVSNASAQEQVEDFKKNEFQVGVYDGGRDYDKDSFGEFAKDYLNGDASFLYDLGLNFQYLRNVNNRLGVGGELNIGASGVRIEDDNENNMGSLKQYNASLMGVGRFYWLNKEHVGLYSKLAIGVEVNSKGAELEDQFQKQEQISDDELDGDNSIRFAVKGTPLGVDFGGKNVRGFFETNVGNSFSMTAGVKVKF